MEKRFLVWDDRSSPRGAWRNLEGSDAACLGINSLPLLPVTGAALPGLLPRKIGEGFSVQNSPAWGLEFLSSWTVVIRSRTD